MEEFRDASLARLTTTTSDHTSHLSPRCRVLLWRETGLMMISSSVLEADESLPGPAELTGCLLLSAAFSFPA